MMRGQKIAIILLFIMLVSFFPGLDQPIELTVIPDTPTSIIFDLHSTTLQLTTDISVSVDVTISRLDMTTNTTTQIAKQTLNQELTVPVNQPGYYLINILSSNLGIIDISGQGTYQPLMIAFWILFLVNAAYVAVGFKRKYFE